MISWNYFKLNSQILLPFFWLICSLCLFRLLILLGFSFFQWLQQFLFNLNCKRNGNMNLSNYFVWSFYCLLDIAKIGHASENNSTFAFLSKMWLCLIWNWKHSLESSWTFPGMFPKIPQNFLEHFRESLVKFPRIIWNIPWNLLEHSLVEC